MKYLISNLKSNKTINEILEFEKKLKVIKSDAEVVICPSHPYYLCFHNDNYTLGAQDISAFEGGSYTGEVNGEQLAKLKVKYVIVGHSERRLNFSESEDTIKNKIRNALKNKIKVIYCIGESKEEYLRKKTYVVIEKQLARVLNDFSRDELKKIIIAYEPIWAIGTKEMPDMSELAEIISFIKRLIKEYYELDINVIYGGSSNDENIQNLKKLDVIDGLLIGTGALDADKLIKMIECLKQL